MTNYTINHDVTSESTPLQTESCWGVVWLGRSFLRLCERLFVRPCTLLDAGGYGERFESPGSRSPTFEPAAFTRPPAEHFSSMGYCPALQGIINRIAGFPVMRCMFLLCFSWFCKKSKSQLCNYENAIYEWGLFSNIYEKKANRKPIFLRFAIYFFDCLLRES